MANDPRHGIQRSPSAILTPPSRRRANTHTLHRETGYPPIDRMWDGLGSLERFPICQKCSLWCCEVWFYCTSHRPRRLAAYQCTAHRAPDWLRICRTVSQPKRVPILRCVLIYWSRGTPGRARPHWGGGGGLQAWPTHMLDDFPPFGSRHVPRRRSERSTRAARVAERVEPVTSHPTWVPSHPLNRIQT